jgi:cytoskeletal protein CcmA (bactofilin family)
MGNLSNLYISQSYQSLIHLGTDSTASETLIELQDGLGNSLGVSLNTEGDILASGVVDANRLRIDLDTEITGGVRIDTNFTASTIAYENVTQPFYTDVVRVVGTYPAEGSLPPNINDVKPGWICNGINVTNGIVTDVSGSGTGDVWVTVAGEFPQIPQTYTFTGPVSTPVEITGSLIVTNDITASNMQLTGDLFVSGTVHAYEVITLIESASVIFSSGSNILGDEVTDTQTIVGQTTISGSLTVEGPFNHTGSFKIVGDVEITGSLYVSTAISSSTIIGIGNVEIYSQSVDSRLDFIEGPFSTSVDQRLDSLEFFSSSEEAKNDTLGLYTSSIDTKLDAVGVYTASINQYTQSNDTRIQNIENYTSSLKTAFTASGVDVTFNGNINVSGSISAYEIHTIIESSSVIFSSGSNVFGDEVSDVQTLNGTVVVNDTLFVSGVEFGPFSQSVDFRLDELEDWSSSLQTTFVTQTELAAATGALEASIATKLSTASFEAYTSSAEIEFNSYSASVNLEFNSYSSSVKNEFNLYTQSQDNKNSTIGSYTGSIDTKFSTLATYTGSNDTKWNTLGTQSGSWITTIDTLSFATTGSNTFRGNNTFSGSVNGRVIPLVITSNTASMDCSTGNFFTLTLVSGSITRIESSNILPGETLTLRVKQPSVGFGNIQFQNTFKFPQFAPVSVTFVPNAVDIITFVTFDTSSINGVSVNNLL